VVIAASADLHSDQADYTTAVGRCQLHSAEPRCPMLQVKQTGAVPTHEVQPRPVVPQPILLSQPTVDFRESWIHAARAIWKHVTKVL